MENLRVQKIIIHEIFKRLDDNRIVEPRYGSEQRIPPQALSIFTDRIIQALGRKSQSIDLTISDTSPSSAFVCARDLLTDGGDNFAEISRRVATKLSEAQTNRNIPGGVVVVFIGTVGTSDRPIAGFIKAEVHGGFRKGDKLEIEYLKDLFLTPQTKLYKIGTFTSNHIKASDNSDYWTARVYDSNMSATSRDTAAQYFLRDF